MVFIPKIFSSILPKFGKNCSRKGLRSTNFIIKGITILQSLGVLYLYLYFFTNLINPIKIDILRL
jgi:hypothetical protein